MKPSKGQLVLLSILRESGRQLARTELVKWVFLLSMDETGPLTCLYEFVPYRYGPFSFSLYRDLRKLGSVGLIGYGQLRLTDEGKRTLLENLRLLPSDEYLGIMQMIRRVSSLTISELLDHVYDQYPYYAINSELTDRYRADVECIPAVYTCGYQGLSLEGFLNKLIQSGIHRLVDVRYNAQSRKYGFSERVLAGACPRVNLQYERFPELGIPGELRCNLNTDGDYARLFGKYEAGLSAHEETIGTLAAKMIETPSVLVCYESDPDQCHRSRLANRIAESSRLEVIDLRGSPCWSSRF